MDDNKYDKSPESIYDKVRELRGSLNTINLQLSSVYNIVDDAFSLSHELRKGVVSDYPKEGVNINNFTLHDLIENMLEIEKEIRGTANSLVSLVSLHLRDPKIQDQMENTK